MNNIINLMKYWFKSIKWLYITEFILFIIILLFAIFQSSFPLAYITLFSIPIIITNTLVHYISFVRNVRKEVTSQKVRMSERLLSNYILYFLMQGVILTLAIYSSKAIGLLPRVINWLKPASCISLIIYITLTLITLIIFKIKNNIKRKRLSI